MRVIKTEAVIEPIRKLCIAACCILEDDVKDKLNECREIETFPRAKQILDSLIENYETSEKKLVPTCQDTGIACVFLEIGKDVFLDGNIENDINEGVRQGYELGYLRKSVVNDPLIRQNTKDNTPAIIYYDFVDGDKLKITVAPKGFGSENMSQIKMLSPSDGVNGIKDFVLKVVEDAGPNPCPPTVVGVGIGGNFDKAALLAKKALLRPLDEKNADEYYEKLEAEILNEINSKGIGPMGLGGKTTSLAVNILTMPTHIAGLPVAVNLNCHVVRHKSIEI